MIDFHKQRMASIGEW
ncbi:hypothetical protein B4U79_01648 [Dinothrombium tinctorium]|uniref:Uncharacterized protein n=1 Tax=Dinothrombium tinctorium TaxID=1965070 RepID=A0A443QSR2_9ACAR|nr:hypothetical protein B4U79_01648 [Dinothrombium tinctorium]